MTDDRAVRADARANRRRIIEAARALYAEEGLDVSFNAVAHRAGIGNATLYRHFGSQDDLRQAVVRARIRECTEMLEQLGGLADPAVELRRYVTWIFETADLSLVGLAPPRRELDGEALSDAADLRARFEDLVARAKRVGVLRESVQPEDILVAAIALVHVGRHAEIPDDRGRTFLETVLRGLGLPG